MSVKLEALPEPWLRGSHLGLPAVPRAVVHALELAREDLCRWCADVTDEELNARPYGLPPVAFHLRHVARSVDRLLTYAEGRELNPDQLQALKEEMDRGTHREQLMLEVDEAISNAMRRVQEIADVELEARRGVGRSQVPSTVGALLVHIADHTQRHVGQAVTTAKILRAMRA